MKNGHTQPHRLCLQVHIVESFYRDTGSSTIAVTGSSFTDITENSNMNVVVREASGAYHFVESLDFTNLTFDSVEIPYLGKREQNEDSEDDLLQVWPCIHLLTSFSYLPDDHKHITKRTWLEPQSGLAPHGHGSCHPLLVAAPALVCRARSNHLLVTVLTAVPTSRSRTLMTSLRFQFLISLNKKGYLPASKSWLHPAVSPPDRSLSCLEWVAGASPNSPLNTAGA